jgi:SAM-dependent methyltransferase
MPTSLPASKPYCATRPRRAVYDLGCATGTTLLQLLPGLADLGFTYIGIDNAPAMIDKARRKAKMFSSGSILPPSLPSNRQIVPPVMDYLDFLPAAEHDDIIRPGEKAAMDQPAQKRLPALPSAL